jgi:hypothetical protein
MRLVTRKYRDIKYVYIRLHYVYVYSRFLNRTDRLERLTVMIVTMMKELDCVIQTSI